MTKDEIWEWMQRDLDGDLSAEEQQLLKSLLSKDPALQLMYSRLQTVSQQLEQLPPVTPSFSIVDSILPKLELAVAKPAAKSNRNVDVLPTLEVKRQTASQLPESKKWSRLTVWLARIGSTAVAACLLIGMMFMGNESKKEDVDPYQQGSQLPSPPVVDTPVQLGPPSPTPSTNPSPPITQVESKKTEKETTQSKKPKQKTTPPPVATKSPTPPPNAKPAASKPVTPPPPVMREEKPPVFPIGLEENSDKEDRHKHDDKEDDDKRDKDKSDKKKNDSKSSKEEKNEDKQ